MTLRMTVAEAINRFVFGVTMMEMVEDANALKAAIRTAEEDLQEASKENGELKSSLLHLKRSLEDAELLRRTERELLIDAKMRLEADLEDERENHRKFVDGVKETLNNISL